MKTIIQTFKGILTLLTLIFILQVFYTAHLQKANLFLRHENQKVRVIEKTVLGYKECPECPKCPKNSFDCPAH